MAYSSITIKLSIEISAKFVIIADEG